MLTFGADPEVFAVSKEYGIISPGLLIYNGIIEKIGGDLKHPMVLDLGESSWIMDGAAFELTLKNPQTDPLTMYSIIETSIDHLREFLDTIKYNGEKLSVSIKPTETFDINLYKDLLNVEIINQGIIFGCDRDYDAIDVYYSGKTINVIDHPRRYGGGHFHLGIDDKSIVKKIHDYKEIIKLIQLFAIFQGNTAIKNADYVSLERERTFHYGKPGRYRTQLWGIEYRTPSNNWIRQFDYTLEMCESAEKAFDAYLKNQWHELTNEFLSETIINILDIRKEKAEEICMILA